jgi:hypothetical protein
MGDDRERPKRSWREIDQMRDRSSPRSPAGDKSGGLPKQVSQKSYRAALDRLFETGGIAKLVADQEQQKRLEEEKAQEQPAASQPTNEPGAEAKPAKPIRSIAPSGAAAAVSAEESRLALLARARDAIGRDPITNAVEAYLARQPWPEDFDFLGQALEHRDDARIREALERLDTLLQREKPRRARTLQARLRTLEETSSEPDLRTLATQVRNRLG